MLRPVERAFVSSMPLAVDGPLLLIVITQEILLPTKAGFGVIFWATPRSAKAFTVTLTFAELLADVGSNSTAVIPATVAQVPGLAPVDVITTVALVPEARLGMLQVTRLPAKEHEPRLG
jgi:hypothetical protein